eukprot:scaffold43818_cov60-Cyclotella_meneghiniana.AAC.2
MTSRFYAVHSCESCTVADKGLILSTAINCEVAEMRAPRGSNNLGGNWHSLGIQILFLTEDRALHPLDIVH